jgi:DNA-binding transcriptional MerR regulator
MSNRSLPDITTHLTDKRVQERVRQNMQRIRREAMVTIGEAARLFGFSESQLRDWERLGLIKPVRLAEISDEVRNVRKQRQYSFEELDKLAAIHELLNHSDLTPGQIAQQVDQLQDTLPALGEVLAPSTIDKNERLQDEVGNDQRYIVQRTLAVYQQLFWRHYVSHVLFLAVRLLYEEVPDTSIGLILPAKRRHAGEPSPSTEQLATIGEALVGWLGQTRSFYTFLTPSPEFEYPSDFLIYPLMSEAATTESGLVEDPTLIVVQRGKESRLRLSNKNILVLVQRLLAPIYEDKQVWEACFGKGMHSFAYPDMDFSSSVSDALLTGFSRMVVRLGKRGQDGEDRWGFCCILLADDTHLPLYQRKLVVRATNKHDHEVDGLAISSFEHYTANLSSRAFLSSCIVMRSEIVPDDPSLIFKQLDEVVRSHVAIPIGGEVESPSGVLYVTSPFPSAFSEEDQRLLRLVARLIEEVLHIYDAKQKLAADLVGLLRSPSVVDTSLKEFLTENDFITDLNVFLDELRDKAFAGEMPTIAADGKGKRGIKSFSEISFITIEIDNQDTIANRYGDRTLRNLSKAFGLRIDRSLPALMARYTDCKLYYVWSGRFYLFLRDFSLEETAMYAERLRIALSEDILLIQSELPTGRLQLPITVHIGVNWYSAEKLYDLLAAAKHQATVNVSNLLYQSLDSVLRLGADRGGNVVFAWDRDTKTYNRYHPETS